MARRPEPLQREDESEQGLVTIRFLGAARTTTGSLHRIRTRHGDLLLECGQYQGHRAESEAWNRDLPVNPARVQAVVLSHGHIDHCGALPNLVKNGYRGPVWCTEATADLLPVMLRDAARIQESDVRRINGHLKKGESPKEPLYTVDDAEDALRLVRGVPYGKHFEAMKDVEVRFLDAGHIIGSAAVHLRFRANGREATLGFTGDLGRAHVPILRDPEALPAVDYYLSESTYGDRDHESPEDIKRRLRDIIGPVVARRGKVIIPAFAVGRTQLVLYLLHQLRFEDQLPDVAFYVDSPMANLATRVFERHRGLYDKEASDFLTCCGPLFRRARTSFIGDSMESKALNHLDGPAVIISASGMCEGGRVLHHLRNHATDPRNAVLFVGYQAEHTLGRRILEGAEFMRIYGNEYRLAAEVHKINGLSAHADRKGLLAYAKKLGEAPKKMFLVHGEDSRVEALGAFLADNGLPGAIGPSPGDWARLL